MTWNLERAPKGRRAAQQQALESLGYDIAILSETRVGFLHQDHVRVPVAAPPGNFTRDERKILLWSRWGWTDVQDAPAGAHPWRWAAGVTPTPHGPVRVIGLCIPYRFAWVRTAPEGHERRRVWQDHESFLDAIGDTLQPGDLPQIIGGDFNQRIPNTRGCAPARLASRLASVLAGHEVATEGLAGTDGRPLLCHLATTLRVKEATVIDRHELGDKALSDHHGAVVTLRPPGTATR